MKVHKLFLTGFFFVLLLNSCSKEVDTTIEPGILNPNASKAKLKISVTDAPIDNANVKACYVTVGAIYLDGIEVSNFNETTIDLLAYQNAESYLLGEFEVDAKSYSSIELKLLKNSKNTNYPHGSYVKEKNGKAHPLLSSDIKVKLNTVFKADTTNETALMIDFDLRKCVRAVESLNDHYDFVSEAKMTNGLRVSASANTHIKGSCNSFINHADEIVVYVYNKGEFNKEQELEKDTETSLQFSNAVTSAKLDEDSNFQLSYLNNGEYELHLFGYDNMPDGSTTLKGKIKVESTNDLVLLNELALSAEANLDLNLLILGIE